MTLDMSKTYDRVEWKFVQEMMIRIGFDVGWVTNLMQCVSMVSYLVIINGCTGSIFHPNRGLRQGNPLSPFLFLICNDGVSALMRLAINGGLSRGAKASRSDPQVSHLFFADDCILFEETNAREAHSLKAILQ